jgi:hypothetical protein
MPPHSLIGSSRFEDDISSLRCSTPSLSYDGAVGAQVVRAAKRTQQAQNLLAHMEQGTSVAAEPQDSLFAVPSIVEAHIADNRAPDIEPIAYAKGPDAAKAELTEGDLRQGGGGDYWTPVRRVQRFFLRLKQNPAFSAALKVSSVCSKFVKSRILHNKKLKFGIKIYYSNAMIRARATQVLAAAQSHQTAALAVSRAAPRSTAQGRNGR